MLDHIRLTGARHAQHGSAARQEVAWLYGHRDFLGIVAAVQAVGGGIAYSPQAERFDGARQPKCRCIGLRFLTRQGIDIVDDGPSAAPRGR